MPDKIDLYAILGCERGDSHKTIQNKFHEAVLRHHPDRGGDPEQFKLAQLAWSVLGNPERRKRYDETGEYAGDKPNNAHAEAVGMVVSEFENLLNAALSSVALLETVDFIKHIRRNLQVHRNNVLVTRQKNAAAITSLRKISGKFEVVDGGQNSLRDVVMDKIKIGQEAIEGQDKAVAAIDLALKLLDGYRFHREESTFPGGFEKWTEQSKPYGPIFFGTRGK